MTDISPPHLARIDAAHDRLTAHETRITTLERDGAVSEERFKHIQTSLDSIQASLSKGVWIVITAVIGGVMAFALAGGLNVGP